MRRVFDVEQFSQFVNNPLIADCRIASDVFLIKHLPQLDSQFSKLLAPETRARLRTILTAFAFVSLGHSFLRFMSSNFLKSTFVEPALFRKSFYCVIYYRLIIRRGVVFVVFNFQFSKF